MEAMPSLIGNTPLVFLDAVSEEIGASVFAKYEPCNPGASIKDRAVLMMLDRAEEQGIIRPGESVIVEPTSGNTGIALAMIAAFRGYRTIICMPESMSVERRALMRAYGAELELTCAADGIAGSVEKANELVERIEGAWLMGQFTNPDNPLAHERTTAPEIEKKLGRFPDYVVAATGTGGTITGVAQYFKKQRAATQFFAVDPSESPLISSALKGEEIQPSPHGIQGIGPNFVPSVLDLTLLDGCISISTDKAVSEAQKLAATEGLLVGISSGANIAAVKKLVEKSPHAQGKTIVTFLVDTGERYISTELFGKWT